MTTPETLPDAPERIWIHPTERQPLPVVKGKWGKWLRGKWKDHAGGAGEVEYVRADLVRADTRPAPASGWQPLETAPKDKYVLLGYEQQGDEMPHGLMVGVGVIYRSGKLWIINADDNEKAWPSSWMPLPPAPGEALQPAPAVEGPGFDSRAYKLGYASGRSSRTPDVDILLTALRGASKELHCASLHLMGAGLKGLAKCAGDEAAKCSAAIAAYEESQK